MLIDLTAATGSEFASLLADYTRMKDVALRKSLEVERGLYMAESSQVIGRAIAAGHRPRSFLLAPKWLEAFKPTLIAATGSADGGDVPVLVGSDELLQSITGFHLHRGALAAMHRPQLPAASELLAGLPAGRARVMVLENIVDHTNVGAAFRSAAALNIDAVLVTPSCADPLYRRSVRVSMGTVFQVPFAHFTAWPRDIATLTAAGFTTAALALRADAVTLPDFAKSAPERVALILGTEGDGLSERTVAACDVAVRIPMSHGVDSLNVAAASAVAAYALSEG